MNQFKSNPPSQWVTMTLCLCFVGLWAVWLLPNTVFIRHLCMVVGAVFGLYVVWKNRNLLLQKEAIPLLLLALLLVWVSIHLIFIGYDFPRQYEEFARIWKKIAISIPFGVGLGIALAAQFGNEKKSNLYWRTIYIGFLLPTIIYFVKFVATYYARKNQYPLSGFLELRSDHLDSVWAVTRSAYVFFCLPAFLLAVANLVGMIQNNGFALKKAWIYSPGLIFVPLIYFLEKDRTGILYCGLTIVAAFLIFIKNSKFKFTLKNISVILFFTISLATIILAGGERNKEWKTMIVDAKIAIQIEKYPYWQHSPKMIDPWNSPQPVMINDMGLPVNGNNYERVAWATRAIQLIGRHPLGYGLMPLSFGALNLIEFPDSRTSLSHSAWLDIALGYGIPGVLLLAISAISAWVQGKNIHSPWRGIPRWVVGYLILLFLSKEVATEAFVNAFIFLIALSAGMNLACPRITRSSPNNS
jgi:O-Antigen ligase